MILGWWEGEKIELWLLGGRAVHSSFGGTLSLREKS